MQMFTLLKNLLSNKYIVGALLSLLILSSLFYVYKTKIDFYYKQGYEIGVKDTESIFEKKQLEIKTQQDIERADKENQILSLNSQNDTLREQIRVVEKDKNDKQRDLEKRLKQYENNKINDVLCYGPNDDGLHIIQDSLK
jgi:hypothetical protein